ncbi:MAG: type II 3-dehydroquinate dehydratase [Vibrio sp.]
MPYILLLNGPNLNLLGTREPDKYGSETLADVEMQCRELVASKGFELQALQSNHEGALVDAIHQAHYDFIDGKCSGIVFNPGAYTHTSIALHDAIKGTQVPVVEVHISNVHARESFRHHSYISPVASGTIIGLGTKGYKLGLLSLLE